MKKILFRSLIALAIVCFLSLSFGTQDKTVPNPWDYIPIPKIQNPTAKSLTHLQTLDVPKGLGDRETAQTQLGDYTSTLKGRSILAVDVDNDGRQEVVVDFGALGVYLYDPYRSPKWERISTKDPVFMIAADRNGDGSFEIYANWGYGNGSEYWEQGTGWHFFLNNAYNYLYFCSADIDDDGNEELVAQAQRNSDSQYQLYVLHWETTAFGGHIISYEHTYGTHAVAFSAPDDELVTYFADSPKLRWWNYISGDSDWTDNWTSMADVTVDILDCTKAEIGDDTEEEFIADIYNSSASNGTWIYNYGSTPKWTRINSDTPWDVRPWPRAVGTNDELLFVMNITFGLWYYAPNQTTKWNRINGLDPEGDGGFVEVFNYDGDGCWDIAVDFGSTGLWKYDYWKSPSWTSMNSNDPLYMIKVNIDTDISDELIVVFETSPSGIWIWNDSATPKWQRINGANPD